MYMIAVLHVLGRGGILGSCERLSLRYCLAWFLEIMSMCSVNCYALISGYAGLGSTHKTRSFITLWFQVLFYTVSITMIYLAVMPESVTFKDIVKSFMPVFGVPYWYFSAYAGVFCLAPVLDNAVGTMPRQKLKTAVIIIMFFFSFMTTLTGMNALNLEYGYSALWLIVLYLVGGYIAKYNSLGWLGPSRALLGYAAVSVTAWLVKLGFDFGDMCFPGKVREIDLHAYTSPLMVCAAVFLLVYFRQLRPGKFMKGAVIILSPLTFGIYLIHVNPFIWNHIMKDLFASYARLPVAAMLVAITASAAGVYALCSAIDFVRLCIFRKLRVRELSGKIAEAIHLED